MFTRLACRWIALLALGAALCGGAVRAQAADMEPGDSVVTLRQTPIQAGKETLASVPPGTRLLIKSVRGDWGAVTVQRQGRDVSGWVHAKHVRVATAAPPGSQYPIVLHVEEGKKPGEPSKLYYSRRQAESVTGTSLEMDSRFLMDARSGLRLEIVSWQKDPRLPENASLGGVASIMSLRAEIPVVLEALQKGFHAAALTGSRKGEWESSQLSNWVVFEVK